VWRYAGSLDVRCVRTCVCNPAALKAAEELHARSKGYFTPVVGEGFGKEERSDRVKTEETSDRETIKLPFLQELNAVVNFLSGALDGDVNDLAERTEESKHLVEHSSFRNVGRCDSGAFPLNVQMSPLSSIRDMSVR